MRTNTSPSTQKSMSARDLHPRCSAHAGHSDRKPSVLFVGCFGQGTYLSGFPPQQLEVSSPNVHSEPQDEGIGALNRPVSSFDIPTRPDPQAQTDSAVRASQDDRGQTELLGQGAPRGINLEKHITQKPYNGTQNYVFLGLIPFLWPCRSGTGPLDINQAGHTPLGQTASSSPAMSRDWTDVEYLEADHETLSGPDRHQLSVHKAPLTRREDRRTFASKSQPSDSLNHSAIRRARQSSARKQWCNQRESLARAPP